MLQAVGYNAVEADDADLNDQAGEGGSAAGGTQAGQPGSLETLLLEKNRHMEHELTMARLRVADLTGTPLLITESFANGRTRFPCTLKVYTAERCFQQCNKEMSRSSSASACV